MEENKNLSSDEKYMKFKNFMHNELKLTKSDIREWIRESVHKEAERMVKCTYDSFEPKNAIIAALRKTGWGKKDDIDKKVFEVAGKMIADSIIERINNNF